MSAKKSGRMGGNICGPKSPFGEESRQYRLLSYETGTTFVTPVAEKNSTLHGSHADAALHNRAGITYMSLREDKPEPE